MQSVHSIARRILVLVALCATLYGLMHTHALGAAYTDHATTSAQTCVLCVSTQTAFPTPHAHVVPPAATDLVEVAPAAEFAPAGCGESHSSRGPPAA